MNIMPEKDSCARREPLPEDRRWRCDFCSKEQWQEPRIYGVPLCSACIYSTAEDATKGHHLACRLWVVEQDCDYWRHTSVRQRKNAADYLTEIARLQSEVAGLLHGAEGEVNMELEICTYCGSRHAPEEWRYCRNTLVNRVYMLGKLAYIGEHHFPDSTWANRCKQIESELTEERETIALLRVALRSIAENFDHDERAHRVGHQDVSCRVCIAEYALENTKGSSP